MRIRPLVSVAGPVLCLAFASSLQAQSSAIPFELRHGYSIIVKGSMGGLRNLNFLIDSGAVPSVVDARVSRRLRLRGQPDAVSLFVRSVPAERVILPAVGVGPIRAESVEALVEDLSFIEEGLGERIDALIGLDILGRMNFRIDYASGLLQFDPAPDPTEVWSSIAARNPYIVLKIRLGEAPTRLMLDTGVKDLVLFQNRARAVSRPSRNQTAKTASNIGGAVRLKPIESPSAHIGQTELAIESAFLLETSAELTTGFDGLLGVAALKPRRVDFDFQRQAIGWKW